MPLIVYLDFLLFTLFCEFVMNLRHILPRVKVVKKYAIQIMHWFCGLKTLDVKYVFQSYLLVYQLYPLSFFWLFQSSNWYTNRIKLNEFWCFLFRIFQLFSGRNNSKSRRKRKSSRIRYRIPIGLLLIKAADFA